MTTMLIVGLTVAFVYGNLAVHASREGAFIGYSEALGKKVVLNTAFGKIGILLHVKTAPETAALVLQLAEAREPCRSCKFYRNEAVPESGWGPPYALLQGSLEGLSAVPPREGNILARRGHVCMIPNTKEFFISLMDHTEWGTAHSVWGEVEDLGVAEEIISQPYHNFTHPTYGTVMRMMEDPANFSVEVGSTSNLPQYDNYTE
eukprot:jgi/Botrbrau1/22188/Bobra.168_1s0020.1